MDREIDQRGIRWDTLPAQYQQEMRAYVLDGVRPGPFIEAVLDDRLQDALEMITLYDYEADAAFEQMRRIGGWLAGQVPLKCFGNVSKVEGWIARKGMNGIAAKVRADVIKAQQIRDRNAQMVRDRNAQMVRDRNAQMVRDRMLDAGGADNVSAFMGVIQGVFGRKSS